VFGAELTINGNMNQPVFDGMIGALARVVAGGVFHGSGSTVGLHVGAGVGIAICSQLLYAKSAVWTRSSRSGSGRN
jgi:hypothetical protein